MLTTYDIVYLLACCPIVSDLEIIECLMVEDRNLTYGAAVELVQTAKQL